ncbi:P-loop NTPase fold protein [Streptomyces sp. NBC_01261]|uniref:P-loop NTPase fold protein n=1 Tax=Streptomyces sp. NBC_01261 TaxID=2903802 RepID=UPI002E34AD5A|nr:P-loop NTPase fold protein [Streptomyces sp. NBC_01261]
MVDAERWAWIPLGQPLTGHTITVVSLAWAVIDGRPVLATSGDRGDTTVRLWDVRAHAAPTPLGQPLTGHVDAVFSLAWTVLDGRPVLATSGLDRVVRLWNVRDPAAPTPLGQLTAHIGGVVALAWTVIDGRPVLATSGLDEVVRLWDMRDPAAPTPLGQLTGHIGGVVALAWTVIDSRPVLATSGGLADVVRLWDVRDPAAPTPLGLPLTGHGGVASLAWAVIDGRPVLATGGGRGDATVRLWDMRDPAAPIPLGQPLTSHIGGVASLAWAVIDGRPVLATSGGRGDATVRFWEVVEDRPVGRLPPYRSDATSRGDDLSRVEEARALAELVTARSATPPLAVGLFGDWGEGKSHFLELMQQQVDATAQPGNPLAHHAVRQVRFNAWHYAETGLWASLVAELFTQLSSAPDQDSGTTQRQLSRLSADLVAQREFPRRLRAARQRRDQLQAALTTRGSRWSQLSEEQRRDWAAVAGDSGEPGALYERMRGGGQLLRGTVRAGWRLVRSNPRSVVGGFLLSVLVLAVMSVGVIWGPPLWARLVAGLPALASVGFLLHKVRQVHVKSKSARERLQAVMDGWRDRLRTAANVAEGEVAALEREVQDLTAAGQLAGLVSERAAGGDYRTHLGLMTQIREDFQRMAALLADPGNMVDETVRDAAGDRLPAIDRIVVYIDDLDRCPPSRVVEMLEAVHLLLAVDLFVVVVAIDPRWLLRAIAAHYRDILHTPAPDTPGPLEGLVDPDDEELWHSTPAQYLEKIFQVVLTLPALDTTGYQTMLRSLVGTRIDQSTPPPSAPTIPGPAPSAPAATTVPPTSAAADPQGEGVLLPAPRVIERVDPLTLDPDEITLMDLLGPPLLVSTPRAVKRLANSYGLLTALRRTQRAHDLTEQPPATATSAPHYPYRAGLVLLAALVAYPQLGPALCLHLHRTSRIDPQQTWAQFRTDLQPQRDPAGGPWSNPADPKMTPVQAQQWTSLLTALHQVTGQAAGVGLPLPELLGPWGDWVVPVARLSFPAGRIVSLLDR